MFEAEMDTGAALFVDMPKSAHRSELTVHIHKFCSSRIPYYNAPKIYFNPSFFYKKTKGAGEGVSHALDVNIDYPCQTNSYCIKSVSGKPNVDEKMPILLH